MLRARLPELIWHSAARGLLLAGFLIVPAKSTPVGPNSPRVEAGYDETISQAKRTMLVDPVRARWLGHMADEQARQLKPGRQRDLAIATAEWIEGEGAYRSNAGSQSGPLVDDALAIVRKMAPSSALHADLLLARARLLRERGATQAALLDLQTAYNIFSSLRDGRGQAKALQSIGSIYQDALDYNHVLFYYQAAEDAYPSDLTLSISANNNMANALLHLGRLRDASLAYERALRLAKKLHSLSLAANIVGNMAELAVDNHDYDRAAKLITEGNNLTQQSAAANWRPMLQAVKARLLLAQHDVPNAGKAIEAALSQEDRTQGNLSSKIIHLTAYQVYKALGDDRRALAQLELFRRMDEQGRALAASTNAALMAARFDFANQNARIATLKAGQLSRDVALTRLRARQSAVLFSSILAFMLTLLIALFFYIRAVRRNRNEIVRTNAQLALTNAELGEALQAKSQFLATTSHEIRTPLNGILGMTQVILADGAVAAPVRDRVMLVDAAGRAMRTLVDDILDFAKIDAGEVRVDAAPVVPTTLMPGVVALWQGQAQAKGIDLRLDVAGVDAPLLTDAARLRQILFNLLSNAIKFTSRGAVVVTVRRRGVGEDAVLTVAVSDTGVGIPAAAHERIFEPFRQLDTTTTRQFGGTGLGLAISRQLARILGGDITLISDSTGSIFTLQLPYRTSAVAVPDVPSQDVAVLVASDNPIRRSFLRTALEGEFGSTAAAGMNELAAFLAVNRAQVVVADVDEAMPPALLDLDSLLRSETRSLFVLLVSATTGDNVARWQDAGVAQVMVKPVRIDALAALIRHTLVDTEQASDRSLAVASPADLA